MNNLIDCRDRTAEFFSTVQSIAKSQQLLSGNGASASAFGAHAALDGTSHRPLPKSGSYGVTGNGNGFHSEFDERPDEGALSSSALLLRQGAPPPKQQSQFTQAAQHIGRSIHLVTEKLEKLGKLAKQRSLFNDPASEINELTYVIKTDLGTLHNELEVLHNWVTANRDAANAASSSSSSHESQSLHAVRNSTAIVDNLKQQLMSTTKSFQEVLQVRTNNLKAQNVARKQFEATGSGSGAGTGGTGGAANGSSNGSSGRDGAAAAVRPGKRSSAAGSGANPFDQLMTAAASGASAHARADHEGTSMDDADEELSFLTPGASASQLMLDAPQDQTDEYLSSRAQAVEDIEGTIVQLGAMYARLVHIVGMQEEITLRIDANMDQALDHMDRGQNELVKYYDSIAGGRWLIIKIFAVLLAFLVFFMVFVA